MSGLSSSIPHPCPCRQTYILSALKLLQHTLAETQLSTPPKPWDLSSSDVRNRRERDCVAAIVVINRTSHRSCPDSLKNGLYYDVTRVFQDVQRPARRINRESGLTTTTKDKSVGKLSQHLVKFISTTQSHIPANAQKLYLPFGQFRCKCRSTVLTIQQTVRS